MPHIVNCLIENVLGVEKVEFAPNGQSITIGGKNGSAKTSTIWAMAMALGGGKYIPEQPVKNGAEKGKVILITDKFTVKFMVKPNRNASLLVEALDGTRYNSPQTFLNEVFGELSFDPGKFIAMDDNERLETLANLVKVDVKAHEKKIDNLYQIRRDINRDVDKGKKIYENLPYHKDVPDKELSVSELSKELQKIQEHNNKIEKARREYESNIRDIKSLYNRETEIDNRVTELYKEREKLQKEKKENKDKVVVLEKANDMISSTIEKPLDTEKVLEQLSSAEELNKKISVNKTKKEAEKQLNSILKKQKEAEANLENARQEFKDKVANAHFPIQGLSIVDNKVVYNGVVFNQLSESERWRISMAIGFSLNPKGILFMRNAGGLDKESRDSMRALAKELGIQLFLEVVDDTEDTQIVIEEGKIKENRL